MSWWDDVTKTFGDFYEDLQDWQMKRYTKAQIPLLPTWSNISESSKSLGLNDNELRYYAQAVPLFGDIARFYDNHQKTKDYMRNRGLSWDDVKYPTSLPSGSLGSSISMMDKNMDAIARLYEDDRGGNELVRPLNPEWNEYGRSKFKKW